MLPEDADTQLARRYEHERPGLSLIRIVDAAVPVTVVTADVLAQERKRFPLLDEFVLRMVAAGVAEDDKLAAVLGLSEGLVAEAIADQFSADTLERDRRVDGKAIRLTPKGRRSVETLASVTPIRENFDVLFDRLAWIMRRFNRRELVSKHEAEEASMIVLPPATTSRVELADITSFGINELLKSGTDEEVRVEVLAVKKIILDKARRFLPAKLLIFADANATEVQVGIAIDGELSPEHDRALERLGGASALEITVETPAPRPELEPELEQVREATASSRNTPVPGDHQSADLTALPAPAIEVRSIDTHEHPPLLQQALTGARRRIFICSPWIMGSIITTDFLAKLERRLQRKVRVDIAHGYEDGSKSDQRAIDKLERLARRYPDLMSVTRLKNTHAKVLIFDDVCVTTSFNWLSFKGAPDRTYRMERGNFVRSQEHVDKEYETCLKIVHDQAA